MTIQKGDNYANTPQSIGELRASREHSGALWSPRDTLICALRELDSGEIKPTDLAIVYVESDKDGRSVTGHFAAYKTRLALLGGIVKLMNWVSGKED